jgi:uncharacterized repeat protein (TIGR02543 family)
MKAVVKWLFCALVICAAVFTGCGSPWVRDILGKSEEPEGLAEPVMVSGSTYTVTFHSNGGSPEPGPETVAWGGKVSVPALMTWTPSEGGLYLDLDTPPVFGGWYTDDTYTTAWNFTDPVTGDLDLYAQWPDTSIDLSGYGGNTLEKALAYIETQSPPPGTNYTILLDAGTTYTMPGVDISFSSNANIKTANAVITLAGKGPAEISLSSNGSLFYISAGKLILDNNITLQGDSTNDTSLVYVDGSSASLTMKEGATITGNTATSGGGTTGRGGGVYITTNSSFTMEGGTISHNTANGTGGGGVEVSGGFFNMSGDAKISGNTANMYGGGVEVSGGSFDMSGGAEISDNTANYYGGGVYVSGASFTMSGGTISGNTATTGGGPYSGSGGGVYVGGATTVFYKSGGTIYGGPGGPPNNNEAMAGSTKGHAVYSDTPVKYRDNDVSDAISVDNGVPDGLWYP